MNTTALKIRTSNSGFTLVESIVAISLFSILILVTGSSLVQALNAIRAQEQATARARIFEGLVNIMGMPATIRAAIENQGPAGLLWKCSRGSTCQTGTPRDVTLFLPPLVASGSGVHTSGAISGPPSSPLRYSADGVPCDSKDATACPANEFPISVSTQFDAICPPAYDVTNGLWPVNKPVYPDGLKIANSCFMAHYIKIHYRFEPTPGAGGGMAFRPVNGTVLISNAAVFLSQ